MISFLQPRQLRFAEHIEVEIYFEMDTTRERFGSLLDRFSVSLLVRFANGVMKQVECVFIIQTNFQLQDVIHLSNKYNPLKGQRFTKNSFHIAAIRRKLEFFYPHCMSRNFYALSRSLLYSADLILYEVI